MASALGFLFCFVLYTTLGYALLPIIHTVHTSLLEGRASPRREAGAQS
jgi:hypothetical protein